MFSKSKRFEYEVTDTGLYFYENGVRLLPHDMMTLWEVILKLDEENYNLRQTLSDQRNRQFEDEQEKFRKQFEKDFQPLKAKPKIKYNENQTEVTQKNDCIYQII